MNLTKGKRKQLVNAAMDNDRVSLTKYANKLRVHHFCVQRVFKGGLTKEKLPKRTSETARDPTVEALLDAHDPDG